jgi:hypothetical protein
MITGCGYPDDTFQLRFQCFLRVKKVRNNFTSSLKKVHRFESLHLGTSDMCIAIKDEVVGKAV